VTIPVCFSGGALDARFNARVLTASRVAEQVFPGTIDPSPSFGESVGTEGELAGAEGPEVSSGWTTVPARRSGVSHPGCMIRSCWRCW